MASHEPSPTSVGLQAMKGHIAIHVSLDACMSQDCGLVCMEGVTNMEDVD